MGDGVNIAARLEGVAKPGAICLSEERLSPGERQARHGGRRPWPDATDEELKKFESPKRLPECVKT
jgi:adenylate cyclase